MALVWVVLAALSLLGTPAAGAPGAAAAPSTRRADSLALALADSLAADSALFAAVAIDSVPPAPARDYVAEVRAGFTPENRSYSRTREALTFIAPGYAIIVGLLILFSGLSAKLRDIAHNLGRRRYVRVLVFLGLYTLIDFAFGFPLSWYEGFALEHQYGLSTMTFAGWMADQGKSLLVGIVGLGVVPVVALLYFAIARSPRRWWLWAGLGTLPVIVGAVLVIPVVVDPLYNTFTPLRDQHLKSRILDLAARADIPSRRVFEVDMSTKTRKVNAYVTGFGASQRIVLWDTTLHDMTEDEILFVMGHEMGHYKLGHIWKGILAGTVLAFVVLFVGARLMTWAVGRWGDRWGFHDLSDVASMPLLAVTLTVLSFVTAPAENAFTRAIEHQADVFGLEITRDNDAAARAFLKLGAGNRSNPEPSAFIRFMRYDHPPLIERIQFALAYHPWQEGRPNANFHGAAAPP